jgi:ribosome-associated protein
MTESAPEERKSKSQIKREMQALRDLGKRLVELPPASFKKVELREATRDAVVAARSMKREALRRQLGRIGALMREEDAERVIRTLDQLSQPHRDEVKAQHELEAWRDNLLAGDTGLIDDLAQRYTALDRQYVRQLVRNATRERKHDKPPKSARALYKYLNELRYTA